MTKSMREAVVDYIESLQGTIVRGLEGIDASAPAFNVQEWSRGEGGRGRACTFSSESSSSILEKAAVNISAIYGKLPPQAVKQMATEHGSVEWSPDLNEPLPFFAGGISIIIHPRSPNVPSAHANYRYFEITQNSEHESPGQVRSWWFGGITDLTPSYAFPEDFNHFHKTLKNVCDPYGADLYPAFKKCADDYFFISHRNEHRGIGGLRFDDLCELPHTLLPASAQRPQTAEDIFAFIQALGNAFLPSYMPILERRAPEEWDERMRRWQLIRRGRYIEFNLVYDRGTKFGLATPGIQVENVLASMPETARWEYMSDLGVEGDGTRESEMVEILKNPRDWAA
ncbi:Coproporphyrinogen oxidase [Flagelloscypha sp. PMI_526]|nr:Coproporphyrinogen oxidase [Flagelloscypha sp. PMI_526]